MSQSRRQWWDVALPLEVEGCVCVQTDLNMVSMMQAFREPAEASLNWDPMSGKLKELTGEGIKIRTVR